MRRFSFRLEPFLKIKIFREKNAEIELSKAVGTCVLLQGRVQDLKAEIQEYTTCTQAGMLLELGDLRVRNHYRTRLERELSVTKQKLAHAEILRTKANETYLAATKERRILEKLKERKTAENYEGQLKEELKRMDEVADRFVLQGRPEGGGV